MDLKKHLMTVLVILAVLYVAVNVEFIRNIIGIQKG